MTPGPASLVFDKAETYHRAEERLLRSGIKQKVIDNAWRQLIKNPDSHGRKFQKIAGRPGLWKSRLNLQWHIVFREERTEQGTVFVAITIENHDDY